MNWRAGEDSTKCLVGLLGILGRKRSPVSLHRRIRNILGMHSRLLDYCRRYLRRHSRRYAVVSREKRIHQNQPCNILLVPDRVLHREGSSPIMKNKDQVPQAQRLYEAGDNSCVMRKIMKIRMRLVGLSKAHKVEGQGPVARCDG